MTKQDLKQLVSTAHHELFTQHDLTALERYFAADFIEHSPLIANGLAGLKQLVEDCPNMQHQAYRVLADGDLVAIHGRFVGLDQQPLVGFDIYRVEGQKIVEHWDGLVPEAAANVSGHSQLDGTLEIGESGEEEANRQLVLAFFQKTLIEGDYQGFEDYTNEGQLQMHSPDIGDGSQAVIDFLNKIRDQGEGLLYSKIHRSIADGHFVLTHSEGSIAGQRHAYFELWRVDHAKIAELWDAIAAIPEDQDALHSYGLF